MDENKGFPIPPKGKEEKPTGKGKTDNKEKPMGGKKPFGGAPKKPAEDTGDMPLPMAKKPMGGKEELVKTFDENEKAVNVVGVSVDDDGEIVEMLDDAQLEEYAKGLLDGDMDVSNLQVGDIFEGPNAVEDAKEMAGKLNEQFAPKAGASDEDIADAAVQAQAEALTMDIGKAEKEAGEDLGILGEGLEAEGEALEGPPMFGSKEYNDENKKLGEELPEDEPILGQMQKAGKAL